MDLSNLRPAEGSKHSDNCRRGRGHGSGNGKTAGKGHKGQLARSGQLKPGFERWTDAFIYDVFQERLQNRNQRDHLINVDALESF